MLKEASNSQIILYKITGEQNGLENGMSWDCNLVVHHMFDLCNLMCPIKMSLLCLMLLRGPVLVKF